MMLLILAALLTAGAYAVPVPLQTPAEAPRPLQQLIDDLSSAAGHTQLNSERKNRLQCDSNVLRSALDAKDQHRPVDRQQVVRAIRDIHNLAESGAFSSSDKSALAADIDSIRKHQ